MTLYAQALPQQATAPPAKQALEAAQMQLWRTQSELRDQLKELTQRRNELQAQRSSLTGARASEIDGRIAIIDQRSGQLEAQLFAVNDQMAALIAGKPVTTTQSTTLLTPQPPRDMRDLGRERGLAWAAFILVGIVAWRGARNFLARRRPQVENSAQMAQLQNSMDAIAIEVERISEAQRYTAKLLNERGLGAGEAQPVPANQREASRVK